VPDDGHVEMPEVSFYHLTRPPLGAVLARLLERVLAGGDRALVRAASAERLEALDRDLWCQDPASFLPHARESSEYAARQPILLSLSDDRVNDASIAVVLDDAWPRTDTQFGRILYLFEADDAQQMEHARARWKMLKASGWPLVYWQQGEAGGWEKRALG